MLQGKPDVYFLKDQFIVYFQRMTMVYTNLLNSFIMGFYSLSMLLMMG